jgi:hypothetical protein
MGESANHEDHSTEQKAISDADAMRASELAVIRRRVQTATKQFRRRMRWRAGVLVAGGAAVGALLIWASVHTRGFWSSLFNGVGAGFLTAAIVGAATAYIAGLWHASDDASNKVVIGYLKAITDQISDLWVEAMASEVEQAERRARRGEGPADT